MRLVLATTACLMVAPAMAQQPPAGEPANAAEKAQMADYLCKLAGECEAPVDAATPTRTAPDLRGFRIASGVAVAAAPPGTSVRPQRFARAPATTEMRRGHTSRMGGAFATRYTTPRTAMAPGAVAVPGRADLMLPFGYNSAELTPAVQARARTFAKALMLSQLRDKRFLIEGHTDARGPRDLNMDLSRRRAQAVTDFLVAQGIDRSRLQASGVGPDQPLPGRSARSEANRRVEAVVAS